MRLIAAGLRTTELEPAVSSYTPAYTVVPSDPRPSSFASSYHMCRPAPTQLLFGGGSSDSPARLCLMNAAISASRSASLPSAACTVSAGAPSALAFRIAARIPDGSIFSVASMRSTAAAILPRSRRARRSAASASRIARVHSSYVRVASFRNEPARAPGSCVVVETRRLAFSPSTSTSRRKDRSFRKSSVRARSISSASLRFSCVSVHVGARRSPSLGSLSHHSARVASSTSASNAESASTFECSPRRWSRHDDDENGASDAPTANVVASSVPASASKSPLSAPFSISSHAPSSARVAATYAPRASPSAARRRSARDSRSWHRAYTESPSIRRTERASSVSASRYAESCPTTKSSAVACSGARQTSFAPTASARRSMSSSRISNTNASSTAPSRMAIKSTLSRKFLNARNSASTSSRTGSFVFSEALASTLAPVAAPDGSGSSPPFSPDPDWFAPADADAARASRRSASRRARSRSCCAAVRRPPRGAAPSPASKAASRVDAAGSSPRNARNASRCACAPATAHPLASGAASSSTSRRSETPPSRNRRVAAASGATFRATYFFPARLRGASPPLSQPHARAGHFTDVGGVRSRYGALYPLNHSLAHVAFFFPAPTSSLAASRVRPRCFQSSSQYSCTARLCSIASKDARTPAAVSAASSRSRICSHQCQSGSCASVPGPSFAKRSWRRISRAVSGSRTTDARRACAPSSSSPTTASRARARCAKDIASARSFTKMASPRIIEDACGSSEVAKRRLEDMPATPPSGTPGIEPPAPAGDPGVAPADPWTPAGGAPAAGPGAPPSSPPLGRTPPPLPNPPAAGGMTYVRCHGAVPKGDAPPPPLRAWSGAVYGRRGADTMTIGGARSGLSPSVSPSALMRAATAKCSSLPSQPGSTPASVTYTAPGSPTPGASRPCWNSNALSAACSTSASPSRVRSISCLLLLRTAYRRFLCRRAAALRGGVPNASERARSGGFTAAAAIQTSSAGSPPPPTCAFVAPRLSASANHRQIVGERSVSPAAAFAGDAPAPFPKPGSLCAFAASSPTPKYSRSGERPGGRATRSP